MIKIDCLDSNDLEFLEELSHELNTQTNDHNANPVFWGIQDVVESPPLANGYGNTYVIWEKEEGHEIYNSNQDTLYYFIEMMKQHDDYYGEHLCMSDEDIENEILLEYHDCPFDFISDHNIDGYYDEGNIEVDYELVTSTGSFLTKKAALEHIELNRHNYKNPRTYAMTAFRNYEYEQLIDILKKFNKS